MIECEACAEAETEDYGCGCEGHECGACWCGLCTCPTCEEEHLDAALLDDLEDCEDEL